MNISWSIDQSLRLVLSFVKNNPAAENTRSASTEVGGMVKRALFTAAMEVVCSLPFKKKYLTLILLRLIQQHYCYNVTGQSQESEGSCKPARIKEVHSKLHSFQASLCTLTATHLTLIYVCTYICLSIP